MDSSPVPEGETPSQRQARLRRERRQAKLASGGADRLKAITGVDKRAVPDANQDTVAQASSSDPPPPYSEIPDPDTSDISGHDVSVNVNVNWNNRNRRPQPQRSGSQMNADINNGNPNDPMLSLLQSLMNPSHDPSDPNSSDAQIPAALASFLNGGTLPPNFEQDQARQQQQTEEVVQRYTLSTSTWRLIHFLSALALSLFALRSSPAKFTGSKASRDIYSGNGELGSQLFMYFAAVETVLLSSRLLLERGKPLSGMLGTVVNLLPVQLGSWIKVLVRYGMMGSSVIQDALVVVWAIGMVGWWNSLSVA